MITAQQARKMAEPNTEGYKFLNRDWEDEIRTACIQGRTCIGVITRDVSAPAIAKAKSMLESNGYRVVHDLDRQMLLIYW